MIASEARCEFPAPRIVNQYDRATFGCLNACFCGLKHIFAANKP